MRKLSECIKSLWAMSYTLRWRLVVTVLVGIVRIAASLGFVWASKHLVDIATGVSGDSGAPNRHSYIFQLVDLL